MKHTSIRKPLSVLLSILMVLSVFGGMAFTASAESKQIGEGVIYKQGDVIVLPGDGDYYVKGSKYSSARKVNRNGTVTRFEGDEYHYRLMIGEWGIQAYLDTFDYEEEMSQGLSVLGIKFTGSGTESDPYMPKLALGEVESTWAGDGEGTEDSPWLIKDLNDLRTLSANVASGMTYSGKYLKLAADIDCGSDNWEAIGGKKKFMGTFDGDSHTITYKVAITNDEKNKGLFYGVGAGGTVKNLNVAGSISCTSLYSDSLGGIAVYNAGTITNCASSVDITGYGNGIAGIAAYCQDGATISYCAASGTISWPQTGNFYAYVAGITGTNNSTTISNCASLCDIIAPNADSGKYAGRLVARDFGGTYSDNYYLSTAQIEGGVNSDYATAKTADGLKEIGQAAYDAGYTVYGLALGAVASNPDQDAADAVIALIDAIGAVEYTEDSKAKIDAAKAAYEAMTDDQKALVGNYETLQLAEGQYAALQLAADMTAFEAYKTAKKSAMDALLQEGDSEAVQSIVGLAKTQINAATYDEGKTLDENKAALDTLVANVPNAVAERRAADRLAADKAAFEAYKAEKKAAVEAMAEEGDSEAAQKIIADAAAAIDALTYDEAETLDQNKAAVDAMADIADALAAQRAADRLAADKAAFDDYKAEQKAAVEAMAEEGDSTDAQQIIADAAAAIEALTYNEAETLDANKAAVDALANIADRLAAQRATDLYAAKIEFDHYKTEQKAAVEAMAQEGDSEAVAQIIAEAAAAIDALIYDEFYTLAENKATVDTLANIADRLAAQRAADAAAAQLAADKAAFDAYKFNLVAAVQAMAQDGDSEAAAQIIDDAAAAIALLDYDTAKTLDENKAAVDALADIAEALAAQRAADKLAADKAAFDDYKAEQKAAVEAMAEDGDSEAARQIIADAAAAIDALTYDEAKTLDQNKAAADEIADIADDLAAQRAADDTMEVFEAYRATQISLAKALRREDDSEAVSALIDEAVAALTDYAADNAKGLDENEEALSGILSRYADQVRSLRQAEKQERLDHQPCSLCGKHHTGSLLENMIGIIHGLIWIMQSFLTIAM